VLKRLLCIFGRHEWYLDDLVPIGTCGLVALGSYWRCRRCRGLRG
jgi:hypothetical protein